MSIVSLRALRTSVVAFAVLVGLLAFSASPPAAAARRGAQGDDTTIDSDERAAFLEKADRICLASLRRADAELKRFERTKIGGLGQGGAFRATPAQAEAFVKAVALKEIEGQIAQLTLLKPSADDADAYSKLLNSATKELAALKANPRQAVFENPFKGTRQAMEDFGLRICGSNKRLNKIVKELEKNAQK